MGKGSKRRPTVVSDKKFQDNWEKVFTDDRNIKISRVIGTV